MDILSERLKELRIANGWSQETVARKLEVTLRSYCRYEAEGAEPKASVLVKMAEIYGVSLDYLAGRTNDPRFEAK